MTDEGNFDDLLINWLKRDEKILQPNKMLALYISANHGYTNFLHLIHVILTFLQYVSYYIQIRYTVYELIVSPGGDGGGVKH